MLNQALNHNSIISFQSPPIHSNPPNPQKHPTPIPSSNKTHIPTKFQKIIILTHIRYINYMNNRKSTSKNHQQTK